MWNNNTISGNQDSNSASVKAILVSVFFLAIVLVATLSGFIGTYNPDFLTSLVVSITFISIFIFIIGILKVKKPWLKYLFVIMVTLAVSYINIFCMMNRINVTWLYGVLFANLFFSIKLSWFAIVFQIITLTVSSYIAVSYYPQNFDGSTPWFILAISNGIQYIVVALVCIAINYRTNSLVINLERVSQEQLILLNKYTDTINSTTKTTNTLNNSIEYISVATTQLKETNLQVSSCINDIKCSFKGTSNEIDDGFSLTSEIQKKYSVILEKGKNILELSKTEEAMNENIKIIINNSIDHIGKIENNTYDCKNIIEEIQKNSRDIINTYELIDNAVKKISTLALSATIESSRYGDKSGGFAIVASEIKKLAQRAKSEGSIISGLIKDTLSDIELSKEATNNDFESVQKGKEIICDVEKLFDNAYMLSKDVNKHIQDIGNDIQKIALGTSQTEELVKNIKNYTNKSTRDINDISLSCVEQVSGIGDTFVIIKNLQKVLKELNDTVSKDKL
ncbi:UNVERIFIED_CONTAM: methyl-accepting chemotaxis protein [Acetivibrio alkalicellulosi]